MARHINYDNRLPTTFFFFLQLRGHGTWTYNQLPTSCSLVVVSNQTFFTASAPINFVILIVWRVKLKYGNLKLYRRRINRKRQNSSTATNYTTDKHVLTLTTTDRLALSNYWHVVRTNADYFYFKFHLIHVVVDVHNHSGFQSTTFQHSTTQSAATGK